MTDDDRTNTAETPTLAVPADIGAPEDDDDAAAERHRRMFHVGASTSEDVDASPDQPGIEADV